MPDNVPEETFDFDTQGIEGWTTVDGQWVVEEMAGAPSGTKVLVQRATKNAFNVIVAPGGPYGDVDISMKFKPISGREDASGGIVFRFTDGKYYVVRANALEDNFRLYSYDRGRRQLASATREAPALGQWHTVRVVAVGDHIQAWLDGALLSGPSGRALQVRSRRAYGPKPIRSPRSTTSSFAACERRRHHEMQLEFLIAADRLFVLIAHGRRHAAVRTRRPNPTGRRWSRRSASRASCSRATFSASGCRGPISPSP